MQSNTLPCKNVIARKFLQEITQDLAIYTNKSNTECSIIRPTNGIYMGSHSLLGSKAISKCEVNPTSGSQPISSIGYNVNLQTAVAAILFFLECPKSIMSQVFVVLRPYKNVKSIEQAFFKISRLQAIVDGRMDGQTGPFYNTFIMSFYGRIKNQQNDKTSPCFAL